MSANVNCRCSPLSLVHNNAGLSGCSAAQASTTSYPKLKFSGTFILKFLIKSSCVVKEVCDKNLSTIIIGIKNERFPYMIIARNRTVFPSSAFMPCGNFELKYRLSPSFSISSLPSMLTIMRPSSTRLNSCPAWLL